MLEKWSKKELEGIRSKNLLRELKLVQSAQGPIVEVAGRSLVCLCSNNYLGFANHPELIDEAEKSLRIHGTGTAASRLISGTMEPHVQAEKSLANFVGTESSLLFSSGYAANVGVIQALLGQGDVIFSDELNHASIIDGCRLSKAKIFTFPHGNMAILTHLLSTQRNNFKNALVVSDALFSMDGDFAEVGIIRGLCDQYNAWMMVDEAHALGVIGSEGRGVCDQWGIKPDIIIGTLGKSFGLSGAFVGSSRDVVQLILNRARSFIFSTASSPAISGIIPKSVEMVQKSHVQRANLIENTVFFKKGLKESNFNVIGGESPILGIWIGNDALAMKISKRLFELGVFALGIRPPTVPIGTSRIRITLMSTHTKEHLKKALGAFRIIRKEFPQVCEDTST